MSKMGSYCSFGRLKHKLWPKEGLGVKLAVWLPTTKSPESTQFTCLQRSCNIPLERSQWELQLFFRLHLHRRFARKVMGLQSRGSPNLGDSGTPTWESRDKKPFGCGLCGQPQSILQGGRWWLPSVRAMVSLVCPCCPWLVLTPKVFQLCTNHLLWVLCRYVWVSEACQLFLIPSQSFSTPLYPSKCCELGSMPRLLPLPLFSTWTHIWVSQGVGSASLHVLCF
jgi:hypothetical protein